MMPINVIDLFAGPGGLGEGFSSFKSGKSNPFKIRLSVEKEASAHRTLTLRAFSRLFPADKLPETYHRHLAGEISLDELFEIHDKEACEALAETLQRPTELGKDNDRIFSAIRRAKKQHKGPWMVIGGPPCQAYSLVGRSRNKGKKNYKAKEDKRHFLYLEYLKVLDLAKPEIFVMENVKGILTAKIDGVLIFPKIIEDLERPSKVLGKKTSLSYVIHSFVTDEDNDLFSGSSRNPKDFVIRAEDHGIPQARHRVILLGVRSDIRKLPGILESQPSISIEKVIGKLPKLRSRLSKESDSDEAWLNAVKSQAKLTAKDLASSGQKKLAAHIRQVAKALEPYPVEHTRYPGSNITTNSPKAQELSEWLTNHLPRNLLNHQSRGHIRGDLGRYLFNACWSEFNEGGSPKAEDFPEILRPNHANWDSGHFADRFRVQARGRVSTTITSHISKDGHYYIHYDPLQCRSLTVREAARLQTFPDNYFFEGNRTQQYVQVGNAVPPYLAFQLAEVVMELLI